MYVGEKGTPIRAEIHDVSRSELRLVLDQSIIAGSAVKVELAGMISTGEIRYCIQREEDSFAAGMRIDSTQKLESDYHTTGGPAPLRHKRNNAER